MNDKAIELKRNYQKGAKLESEIWEAQQKFDLLENNVLESLERFFLQKESFTFICYLLTQFFEKIEALAKKKKYLAGKKIKLFQFLSGFLPVLKSILKIASFIDLKKLEAVKLNSFSEEKNMPNLRKIVHRKKPESKNEDLQTINSKNNKSISFYNMFNKLYEFQDSLGFLIRDNNFFSILRVFFLKADHHKISLPLKMEYIR